MQARYAVIMSASFFPPGKHDHEVTAASSTWYGLTPDCLLASRKLRWTGHTRRLAGAADRPIGYRNVVDGRVAS